MQEKKVDPFELSVEIDGIAALCSCLSIQHIAETDTPSNALLQSAFQGLEMHLKRISDDVCSLEKLVIAKGNESAE